MNLPSLPASLWLRAVENYRTWLAQQGLSPKTVENYVSDLRRWLTWLNERPGLLNKNLTDSAEQYLQDLATSNPQSTVNRRTAALRRFADFLAQTPNQGWNLDQQLFGGAPQRPSAWSQWLDRFAVALSQAGCKDSELQNLLGDVGLFLSRFPNQDLEQTLTKYEVAKYLRELRQKGTASSDLIETRKSLHKFAAWATEAGFFLENPLGTWLQRLLQGTQFTNVLPRRLNPSKLAGLPAWKRWYLAYHRLPFTTALHLAVLVVFASMLSVFAFRQFGRDVTSPFAYPSTAVRPNRQLSFQGRLTDSVGTPITTGTNVAFSLHDADTAGNELWNSGVCIIDPDQDGIFSTSLGESCGSEIPENVFSELANVWLEIEVGGETLSPRQPISSVPYALNTETVQGFPISLAGNINTIPVINALGEMIIGASNPSIIASSGAFLIQGESLNLATEAGGDITLTPGAGGTIEAVGNTNITGNLSATGTITFSSLTDGLVRSTSGVLSGGNTVSLTTDVTGILPIANGGTNSTATPTAGGIAYGTGTAYAFTAAGSSGECFISAGTGAPTWGSCAGAVSSSIPWQVTNGTANLKNTTLDLLVGGDSTASAKFAVLNVNSGTPTASVSAGTAGAFYFTASGSAQTTARQNLSFGGGTSGNILFNNRNNTPLMMLDTINNRIGIGTTSPAAKLDVYSAVRASNSSTNFIQIEHDSWNPILRWSGGNQFIFASNTPSGNSLVVMPATNNQYGLGNSVNRWASVFSVALFGGSSSQFQVNSSGAIAAATGITSSGTITLSAFTNNGGLLYTNGSGVVAQTAVGANGECLVSAGGGAPTWGSCSAAVSGSIPWQVTNGTANLKNTTLDLLVGGDSTASARAAFLNINSGTPTASLSAGVSGGSYFTAAGNFQTTANQNLTLGGNTTGDITLMPRNGSGRVGIGTTSPSTMFHVTAAGGIAPDFIFEDTVNGAGLQIKGAGANNAALSLMRNTNYWDFLVDAVTSDALQFRYNGSEQMRISSTGNVGIGNTSPAARLTVTGAGGANTAFLLQGGASQNGNLLQVTDSTGALEYFKISPTTGFVLNEVGSSAVDVRIEGDNDANLFFTDASTDRIGIGTNTPASALEIGGTGVITIPSGSVGAPSIAFSGNTNTGVYRVGANTVGVAAGGNAAATFASNGSVTLGTWGSGGGSVVVKPTSGGAGNADRQGLNLTLASGESTGNGVGSNLIFQTSPTGVSSGTSVNALVERMRIAQDGNVGIGDTSPAALFTVGNGDLFQINSSGAIAAATGITSSGTITFSGLTNGIVKATSGVLSGGNTVSLTADVSGILPIANGGTNSTATPTAGGVAYGTGTAYAFTAAGSSGECFKSNGTSAPTWGSCTTGVTEYWGLANGALSPLNPTTDLLVGGSATGSAKFGLINVNSGTPTFQIQNGVDAFSVTSAGYLYSAGNITLDASSGAGDVNVNADMNLSSGNVYQINGTSVLSNNTLGSGVLTSSLTTVGALSSGSISSGFGTIATANTITGTTINGTTGINTGAGAGTQRIDASGNILNVANISASGTITFSGLTNGIVKATSGVLSGGNTVSLTSEVSGVLPIANGGTNSTATPTQGGVAYGTGTAYAFTAAGSSGECFKSNGTSAPTWGSCAAGITEYWGITNGALSALNTTTDFLIGGSATNSAKFAVLNVNSGTPTASVSAGTAGATYLTATGTLQSTANQNLTLGGNTTGDITISPRNGSGSVGIGTTPLVNRLINTAKTFTTGANSESYRGLYYQGLATVNHTGASNIGLEYDVRQTAGTNGATDLIALKGTSINQGGQTVGNLYGADLIASITSGGASNFAGLNTRGTVGGSSVATARGVASIAQRSSTVSSSARAYQGQVQALTSGLIGDGAVFYAVAGTNAGTWTNQYGLYVENLTAATNNYAVYTAGSTASYFGGNVGIGDTTPAAALTVGNGDLFQVNSSGAIAAATGITSSGTITFSGLTNGIVKATSGVLSGGNTVTLTSEVSGVLPIANGGTNGTATPTQGGIAYGTGTAYAFTAAGTSGQCLLSNGSSAPSWGSCVDGVTQYWAMNNGALSAVNQTADLLIGATATSSARAAFLNILTGTPTASLSAGASGGTYFTAAGTLQTTANQNLTLGGNTTGDIILSPFNGSGRVNSTGDINLSSGKAYLINGTSVLNATTLGSGVTTSSLTTVGALSSGSITSGFGTIATTNTITGSTLIGTSGVNTGVAGGTQRIDGSGNLVNIGSITASGAISGSSTITGTTINGTTGINTGGGAGTQRLDSTGNLVNIANITASGTITFSGLTNGIIKATSGVLSGGNTVTLTSEVSGILPIANGGTNASTVGTAGSIAYSTGSAYAFSAAGSSGQCLVSGGTGAPTWSSCADTVSASIPWQITNGAANLKNTTVDMLIGGNSTASAKFAFLNVNFGTPTASISAGTAGATYLTANGTLQTTANQNLTIGGNTTGNIALSPLNGSGTTTNTGTFTSSGGVVNLNVSSNNAVNIATGTSTGTITLGGSAAQTIDIGTGAAAKTVTLGSTNTTSTTNINSGSSGVYINNSSANPVYISSGSSTGNVIIGGANNQIISIGSGSGNKTITLGSTTSTSTTTINSGTGGLDLNSEAITIGSVVGDTVTVNSGAWTFANDTNFVLSGGTNGLSFDTNTLSIDATNDRVGIGTTAPAAKLESLATTEQLRLSYDATNYVQFTVQSNGDLNINPVASVGTPKISLADDLQLATGNVLDVTGDVRFTFGTNLMSVNDELRVTFDPSNYTQFTTSSGGDLTIDPTGGDLVIDGNLSLNTGFAYQINGTSVLNATTLGSGVVNSSLTSVGTLTGLTVNGALTASGGTINLNVNSNNAVNIGTGTSTGTITLGGSGTSQIINIGTIAGITKSVNIGYNGGGSTTAITGGNLTLSSGGTTAVLGGTSGGGALNLNVNNSTSLTNIGTGTTTGTITIGGTETQTIDIATTNLGSAAKTLNLGAIHNNSTTNLLSGTGGINLNVSNNQPVNIGSGTSTGLITIGGTGTQTISLGTGAGVKTVQIGSTNTTSSTTINSGSSGLHLNTNVNNNTFIGAGTSTGLVTIGGGSGTVAINTTSWDISSAGVATGFTGITTTNTLTAGALTTTNDTGALTLGRQDNVNEGAQITMTGAGSFDTWFFDLFQNNPRLFTVSANNNEFQIFNNSTGVASLSVEGYVMAGIGSSSAPSFTFAGDPNTGMYQAASDVVGFTAGGTNSVNINSIGLRFLNTSNAATCDASTVGTFTYQRDNAAIGLLYLCREQATNGNYAWRSIDNTAMSVASPDLAEYAWASDLSLGGGDIVAVTNPTEARENFYDRFNIIRASSNSTKKVLGVVSSDPGIILNRPDTSTDVLGQESSIDPHLKPLTLAGRVPVKVVTADPLNQGDRIGLSPEFAGIGSKLTGSGFSVGTVLTSFDPATATCTNISSPAEAAWPNSNKDECYRLPDGRVLAKVLILVNNEYSLADSSLQEDGSFTLGGSTGTALRVVDDLGNQTADITASGAATFRSVAAQEMSSRFITAESILITGDATVEGTLTAQSARIQALETSGATVSGTLYADRLVGNISADSVEGLEARISALVAAQTASNSAAPQPDPETQGEIDTLAAGGSETTPVVIPGDLIVQGLLQADGGVSTSTLMVEGTLLTKNGLNFETSTECTLETGCNTFAFQSSGVGTITFLNNLVVMSNGTVEINGDLAVTGTVSATTIATNTVQSNGQDLTLDLSGTNEEGGDVLGALIVNGEAEFTSARLERIALEAQNAAQDESNEDQSAEITASSGTATLKANKSEYKIRTSAAQANSLVYLTATSQTGNKTLYIAAQEDGSFTVALDGGSHDSDITFNWWVVGQ